MHSSFNQAPLRITALLVGLVCALPGCPNRSPVQPKSTAHTSEQRTPEENGSSPANLTGGSPNAEPAESPSADTGEAEGPTIEERVRKLLRDGRHRPDCNDLTGCPLVTNLLTLGPDAVPIIQSIYRESRGDGFWRQKLLETLGRIEHPASPEFLLDVVLNDTQELSRIFAALALARLHPASKRSALEEWAKTADPELELPVLLAVGTALGAMQSPAGREILEKYLVVPQEETLRWDRFRPGIYGAGLLRLVNLRERVEEFSQRADPFVRRECAKTLGAMRERAGIPTLITLLRDDVPGVRAQALRSLRALTGFQHKETADQWQRWWASTQASEPPQ